jgi:hypothetical protein
MCTLKRMPRVIGAGGPARTHSRAGRGPA